MQKNLKELESANNALRTAREKSIRKRNDSNSKQLKSHRNGDLHSPETFRSSSLRISSQMALLRNNQASIPDNIQSTEKKKISRQLLNKALEPSVQNTKQVSVPNLNLLSKASGKVIKPFDYKIIQETDPNSSRKLPLGKQSSIQSVMSTFRPKNREIT